MPMPASERRCRGGVLFAWLTLSVGTWGMAASCDDAPVEPTVSTEGEIYLESAWDTLQAHYVYRAKVDWPGVRRKVREEAGAIVTTQDAHAAIYRTFELIGAKHSNLYTPTQVEDTGYVDPPPLIRVAENFPGKTARIGYVRVQKSVGRRINDLATSYQRGIERVDSTGICGWIVDLQNNFGGSMWPMIAGVGPLLGEGTVGYFVYPDSTAQAWSYEAGASRKDGLPIAEVEDPYSLLHPGAPVAVLVNGYTASSAEATAIAFVGRPNTLVIGSRTAGYTTYNLPWQLSDGAVMLVTVALMADRTKETYGDVIYPDTTVGGATGIEPELHTPYGAALTWLAAQPACTGG